MIKCFIFVIFNNCFLISIKRKPNLLKQIENYISETLTKQVHPVCCFWFVEWSLWQGAVEGGALLLWLVKVKVQHQKGQKQYQKKSVLKGSKVKVTIIHNALINIIQTQVPFTLEFILYRNIHVSIRQQVQFQLVLTDVRKMLVH